MVLASRLSCLSDAFSSFSVDLNWCHSTKLDFFDESDSYGYGSGSPGGSVGSTSGIGFGDFVLTGIESIGDVVLLVVFVPRGVKYKVGQPIGIFWRPKY